MRSKLWPIIWKEALELRRDRLSLYTYIFLPSFLLFLYGYAISLDVKHIKTVICDLDNSNQSRELARKLFSSEYFDSAGYAADEHDLERMMRTGRATAGILIHPDFSRGIKAARKAPLLVVLDGSNAQVAQSAITYIFGITTDFQLSMLSEISLKTGLKLPLVDVRERIWYNQRLESSINLITGLIAFVLMIVATIATTLAIVREKENGSIEQMVVTPVSALTILIGKIIPYFALSVAASILMIIFAIFIFGVPFVGSALVFSAALFLFLLAALGLGLFISTISQSQQFAFTAATFITVLPTNILSGFIFPIDSMPKAVQYFTYIVPARYFIEISRSVMLKGSGFEALTNDFIALGIFAVIFMAAAAMRIRVKGLM
jgi:ABC-2 type transport system permease protein